MNPAYVYGFRHFQRWCAVEDVSALPAAPASLVRWMGASSLSPTSFTVYLQGIRTHHEQAGHPDPTRDPLVRETLARLVEARRRRYCRCPSPPTGPPVFDRLCRVLPAPGDDSLHDRAWLLLAYGGGLRLREVRGLRRRQLAFTPQGLVVELPRGVAVIRSGSFPATDPVTAVDDWLAAGDVGETIFKVSRTDPRRLLGAQEGPQAALTETTLAGGLAEDAQRAGASQEALERHLGRRGDVQTRFQDALTRRVGL